MQSEECKVQSDRCNRPSNFTALCTLHFALFAFLLRLRSCPGANATPARLFHVDAFALFGRLTSSGARRFF